MFRWLSYLLCCFVYASSSLAAIYKHIDEKGNVVFSDKPAPGSLQVELPSAQKTTRPQSTPSFLPSKEKQQSTEDKNNKPPFKGYQQFSINAPSPDAMVRNNEGNVIVQLTISPKLQIKRNHVIQLTLDARPLKKTWNTASITLQNLDRGTHFVDAAILDSKTGKVLKRTATITFHLQRFSANFRR